LGHYQIWRPNPLRIYPDDRLAKKNWEAVALTYLKAGALAEGSLAEAVFTRETREVEASKLAEISSIQSTPVEA
jgi:hypothetical protein